MKLNFKNRIFFFFDLEKNKWVSFFKLIMITFLVFPILWSSCFTPAEGCLDIDATNFNASADESCSDCCIYPQLNLNIAHNIQIEGVLQADTCINFTSSTFLTNDNVDFFQLDDVSFYLSDFELEKIDGTISEVINVSRFYILDDIVTQTYKDTLVKNDFVLVKRTQFAYSIGEFRAPGTYAKLRFQVGILPRLNSIDPDTLATTHSLSSSQGMYDTLDNSFLSQRFTIEMDTSEAVEMIEDFEIGGFSQPIPIELDFPNTFQPGFDVDISLKINYTKWLQGINFATDSEAEIKSKIVSNTAEAIEIAE